MYIIANYCIIFDIQYDIFVSGLFAVWSDIFHIKRTNFESDRDKSDLKHSLQNRMQKILQVVSSFGDYERVSQGVFENYPLLKLRDASFETICKCMDWFVFSDIMSKQIYTLQNYSISSYLQYAFVIWHFAFATTVKQKLNYPNVGYEVSTLFFFSKC